MRDNTEQQRTRSAEGHDVKSDPQAYEHSKAREVNEVYHCTICHVAHLRGRELLQEHVPYSGPCLRCKDASGKAGQSEPEFTEVLANALAQFRADNNSVKAIATILEAHDSAAHSAARRAEIEALKWALSQAPNLHAETDVVDRWEAEGYKDLLKERLAELESKQGEE